MVPVCKGVSATTGAPCSHRATVDDWCRIHHPDKVKLPKTPRPRPILQQIRTDIRDLVSTVIHGGEMLQRSIDRQTQEIKAIVVEQANFAMGVVNKARLAQRPSIKELKTFETSHLKRIEMAVERAKQHRSILVQKARLLRD